MICLCVCIYIYIYIYIYGVVIRFTERELNKIDSQPGLIRAPVYARSCSCHLALGYCEIPAPRHVILFYFLPALMASNGCRRAGHDGEQAVQTASTVDGPQSAAARRRFARSMKPGDKANTDDPNTRIDELTGKVAVLEELVKQQGEQLQGEHRASLQERMDYMEKLMGVAWASEYECGLSQSSASSSGSSSSSRSSSSSDDHQCQVCFYGYDDPTRSP